MFCIPDARCMEAINMDSLQEEVMVMVCAGLGGSQGFHEMSLALATCYSRLSDYILAISRGTTMNAT
jgi:hypothetical protein